MGWKGQSLEIRRYERCHLKPLMSLFQFLQPLKKKKKSVCCWYLRWLSKATKPCVCVCVCVCGCVNRSVVSDSLQPHGL